MANKNYTTKAKVEALLGETITENIDDYIIGAQEYIDNFTQRDFSENVEERFYNGNNSNSLLIDPATDITKVEVSYDNGVTFKQVENFKLLPNNNEQKIKIYFHYFKFPFGVSNIKVTGKFGWGSVPKDIEFVATSIVVGMIKGKSTSEIASEKIGDYSVSYQADQDFGDLANLKDILNRYKVLL